MSRKILPKIINPDTITFISLNRFEPIEFMKNSPNFGNNTDNNEESYLCVHFKSTFLSKKHSAKPEVRI